MRYRVLMRHWGVGIRPDLFQQLETGCLSQSMKVG